MSFFAVNRCFYGKVIYFKIYAIGFFGGNVFYIPCISVLVSYGKSASVTLPSSVKVVLPYAFQYRSQITDVTMSEGAENIGIAEDGAACDGHLIPTVLISKRAAASGRL